MTKNNKSSIATITNAENLTIQSRLIAVGASAGGLEALKAFFQNIPQNDKNSYVVIQHLSPAHKSMMGELLKKNTSLPIVEISDNIEVKPGHIYLIPPVSNLILKNGTLHLLDKPKHQKLNLPIDMFFESLARHKKEKAIGIILSGTGSDGTRGARAIKEHDGMVMVQDPDDAKFDGMPRSAINTGLVDYILPVSQIGPELGNFINAPAIFNFKEGTVEYEEKELGKILKLVDEKTGLDFREYKHATLARRVARRVNVCKCQSLAQYYNFLKNNPQEVEVLYREFLIGVTKFFRDIKMWDALRRKVIPELIREKKHGETLKIWNVACSTGEEPYSLAMLLNEEMERQNKHLEIKIFATDIAEKHLEIGSRGLYPESIVADIDPELLVKYFLTRTNTYQVVEKIRRMVIFSKHNIIKNPPFSSMDMVMCRNLLIYFQSGIQNKAMNVLHYALREGGTLVLGTSESVQSHKENFVDIDRKWKIYKNIKPRTQLESGVLHSSADRLIENRNTPKRPVAKPTVNPLKQKLRHELNEAILEQFGGASVFIDKDYNILQAVGEFRKYANLPVSGFSINLLDMLGTDLKHVAQIALKKAAKNKASIFYKDAAYKHNGENKAVDLIVKPFVHPSLGGDNHFVVTFIEKKLDLSKFEMVDQVTLTSKTKEYVSALEEELKITKEELRASLEEIETSNEELQAANEELLASNEELQSTNEELQSVNEEINTVNAENVQKMDDLAALNADMNNLLESTGIGTIFLDSQLCIRKFTPAIQKHFSFINSDVGRPIEHFASNIGKQKLIDRCKKVLGTGKTLEKNIKSAEGKHYLRRISPYKDSNDEIKGIVITFVDIETIQKSREQLLASEKRFKSLYEEDPVLHISVDPKTSLITHCNKTAVSRLGYNSKEELIGFPMYELYDEEAQIVALKSNKTFEETGELMNLEQNMLTRSGDILPVILNATAEKDEEENILTIRYTCVDISAIKEAEEKLRQQKTDLERANRDLEQFVSICSHDLQEPLSTIKFGSDILGKIYASKLDDKAREYLSYIDNASNRLSGQIKALLEHSKIGRNGEMSTVNTKELVEVVKYDLGKRIKDTGAKIHCGSLPRLKAYEVELRLLFQNLISNAIKYAHKDRVPEIRISAFKEDKHWVFAIMDNGQGISQEDQKNIFTIFNRVPGNDKMDGTGVGLAHVEKIVMLHEGTIWVDSQVGVGSTFYFKLRAY